MNKFPGKMLASVSELGRSIRLSNVSYIDVPEFVLRDCPLCGSVAVFAAKGCHDRQYRIYCSGMTEKPAAACTRQTAWWHMPEAAEVEWKSDQDVPLPLFPGELSAEKVG